MSKEAMLVAEVTVLTEMVRVLSDKLAIEQNKQEQGEPVAWMDIDEKGTTSSLRYWSEPEKRHEVALYITPPQRTWVGLTEEDFVCVHQLCDTPIQAAEYVNHLLKEKNNA
jgi:hypothetical protein